MKIAYLDCLSGISGDMTLGAMVDAGVPLEQVQAGIDSLGISGLRLAATPVKKHGFRGTKITVEAPPERGHRHLHHIHALIDGSTLSPRQKDLAKRIFDRLGEAEARVHGTTMQKVHFHEVGAADSIADIVGSAIAWDLLGAERLYASPVPTGTGFIEIAHGRVSVPAPATAELLVGVPLAESRVAAELTTPTGAAILTTLVSGFGPLPAMTIERIGWGAGERDLAEQPNLLRLIVGQASSSVAEPVLESLLLLEANLDDLSGEAIGYCQERLWGAGALDVFTTPIYMKKNRPGVLLSVLCEPDSGEVLEEILFRETTTLGVRRGAVLRRKLPRRTHSVSTRWGQVAGKLVRMPNGETQFSPEFDACRAIAEAEGLPWRQVFDEAARAFAATPAEWQIGGE